MGPFVLGIKMIIFIQTIYSYVEMQMIKIWLTKRKHKLNK